MFQLRPYQQTAAAEVQAAWGRVRSVLLTMATGSGKCLGKGTPVLMYDGTVKNVEDVKRWDYLIGPDSKVRFVLSVCQGREMLYRVTPVKGDPYVVNESHILSLKRTGTHAAPRFPCQRGKGRIVNMPVREYVGKAKTFKHKHKGWRSRIDWKNGKATDKLPPYLLGLWLGDGSSNASAITTADPEIFEYLANFCASNCFPLRTETISETNAAKTYFITGHGKHKNTFLSALRKNNLILNKHIPLAYKTACRRDRLKLLAGLVDSDGSLQCKGYDFVFKSKRLAEDTVFLARSLGMSAYMKECQKTCTNNGAVGTYYRFNIDGPTHSVPVLIERKRAAVRLQKKDVLVTGIKVKPIGVGDYYGFELSGDGLFLLGDFTVTHNTVVFSHLIHEHPGAAAVIAHRREIVSQIACSLAELGVKHRIIAPPKTTTLIRRKQLKRFGQSYIDPNAATGVISVQTLTSKHTLANQQTQRWLKQVTLLVTDEHHHYVKSGFWSRAVEQFSHALMLGATATPERADGNGLAATAGGYVEEMIEGPQTWELIREGYLSPFVYRAPASDLDVSGIPLTKQGDFNARAFRQRVVKSHLVGDIIEQYKRYGNGGRAIVFATEVETAEEMAVTARREGIAALALSGKSHESDRTAGLERFESGEIRWLVNVDLFDEGVDVPAAEVCIQARPTESTAKYLQMVGRVLRPVYADGYDLATAEGRRVAIAAGPKPNAVIIDPVRNWERHGLPNWPRSWSLAGREHGRRTAATDTQPLRVCTACTQPFEAFLTVCPYCGAPVTFGRRSSLEQVDGDLLELDQAAMAAVFAAMQRAEQDDEAYTRGQIARHIPAIGRRADLKRHQAGRYRRGVLRHLVGWWVGGLQHRGVGMNEIYRRFYFRYGIDIATAFTLNAAETDALAGQIARRFTEDVIL